MRKSIIILFVFILSFLGLYTSDSDIMKLSEIKPGMEGEGKTIFKSTKIETFKFKVLGVIEKFTAGKSLIFVELFSPVLTESGIISGMSGSPVYIDGKLIGAVAYGIPFSKRPIGGVTPIEDIIKTDDYNKPTYTIDISNVKIQFDKENIEFISNLIRKELIRRVSFSPHEALSPIRLIGTYRGMDPSVLSYLTPVFSLARGLNIQNQFDSKKVNKKLLEVSPADAAAIPLIRGDFDFSASGTVTYVKDNKIYCFGHPFFNLGSVNFPLHKAEIISVIPSYRESIKLAATRNMIGTVVQDRFSAVQAELGKLPYMIPIKVFLENRNRNFNLEMVHHPLLTPVLGSIALDNIFMAEYKEFGFQSLRVKGKIFIENEKNVIIDDLFSGFNAPRELGNLLLAINFFLMNNKDKNIKIQKITFEINGSEQIRNTTIENVIMDKQAYYPGELINITIFLKNERGNSHTEKMKIKAPNLKADTVFYLMVADKTKMLQFDAKNIKSKYFPMKLNSLIRAINNLRKNNRIYLKLMTTNLGVFIKGHEYSNIPSSLENIFGYNSSSGDQSKMKFSTITEYQHEIPAVLSGNKLFKLRIKERSDVQ